MGTCSTMGQRLDHTVRSVLSKAIEGLAGELLLVVYDAFGSNSRTLSLRDGTWNFT